MNKVEEEEKEAAACRRCIWSYTSRCRITNGLWRHLGTDWL